MKLYVKSLKLNKKIYLDLNASTRQELAQEIGKTHFNVGGSKYSINDVYAESGSDSTALGMVIGGVLGLIGGTPGVLIGGAIGGVLGNSGDNEEVRNVERFNRSAV